MNSLVRLRPQRTNRIFVNSAAKHAQNLFHERIIFEALHEFCMRLGLFHPLRVGYGRASIE